MTRSTPLRRRLAVVAAGAVTASTLLGVSAPAQAAVPAPTHGATIDYFADVYPGLGTGSVFETVTVERFEYILKRKTGNFAFFIGDPNDASSKATIKHVNDVAKAQGIKKIYNFTPKLDGDTLNIWDLSKSNLRTEAIVSGSTTTQAGLAQYETLGNRLLSDYLNKDTTPQFTKNATTDPYLFVYNKDAKVGDAEDRIVSSLTGPKTASDLDTPAEVDGYKAQVAAVLDDVPAPQYATNTQFDFNRDEHNRRHFERYVKDADPTVQADKLARFGGDIFDESDAADGFRIETITYPELQHLLKQPGDFPILFGGTWCHNTAAIIKDVNRIAQEQGVKKVYNFDFSLDSTGNGSAQAQHIRDNARVDAATGKVTRPSHLYGDLVNTYLTNAITEYRTVATQTGSGNVSPVNYYPGGDTTKELKQARKIQVGHVLTYNKDRKDAFGNAAPVVDQAIRQNDDGGNTEHMTEWWFVKGRDLAKGDGTLSGVANPASEAGANALQNQRAFAKEGIDEIDTLFRGLAGQSVASTTTVAPLDSIAVGGTPTVEVSVGASGFAPFISLNTANQNVAANTTTGKPRGVVAVLNGTTKIAEARLKRDGTASIKLPPQTAGQKSYTVTYLGRGDRIDGSQATASLTVVGDPSTTTLSDLPTRAFGTASTATATVSDGATGTVSLQGLPGGVVESEITGGTATYAVPASIPAGSYSVTAKYNGDTKYGVSTSEPRTLTVTKAPTSVTSTVTDAPYGTASTVAVTVSGPAGHVPTGTVTVTAGGSTQSVRIDGQGRGSVSLPSTLAPKSYAVTAVYAGSIDLIASSGFGRVTVAKGVTKTPVFAAKGTVKAKKNGKASINVSTPSGLAKATGKVRVQLKKGSSTKTVTVALTGGRATAKLPKLTKGTWSVKVTYLGDATYAPTKAVSIRKKLKVKG